MESEAHGEGAMRVANEDAGAVASAAGTACGGQGVPGGAAGRDGPGDLAGLGDTVSRGIPGDSGDLADPRDPSAAGSQVAQPVPFCRSRGHPTHQGLVETLHPEQEF